MTRSRLENEIANVLAAKTVTSSADWYCVFKARLGMLVAFESIRDVQGEGTVGTQLLTCCTAVDPIIQSGLKPHYLDISTRSAAIDPHALSTCGKDMRAVVLQHTYGIIDVEESRAFVRAAHEKGLVVVEDCAHCVGRMALDEFGAPLADISVHSFGIEKVIDTLFGGAIWVNPASPFAELAIDLAARLSKLPPASTRLSALARINRFLRRVHGHGPRVCAWPWRHGLSACGLFDPAVAEVERRGGLPYEPVRPSAHVCEKALAGLATLGQNEENRTAVTAVYRERLQNVKGVEIPAAALEGDPQPLLKFPILVADTDIADCVIEAVCSAGYFTSAWYRPELTPGVLDASAYSVPHDRSNLAQNDDFIARVATLPTNIPLAAADSVVDAVLSVVSS